MSSNHSFPRRAFLQSAAFVGAAAAIQPSWLAAEPVPEKRFKLIGFTKPFRNYNPTETAELVAEVGWDGVELPVRARSEQIKPEQVEDELPKFAEALRRQGREITIVTTDITSVTPLAEKILRTAVKLGIPQYRLGSIHYAKDKPIAEQLQAISAQLREVAAMNKSLGIEGGYQNHSGRDYVGAPVWDLWTIMKDLNPRHLGLCFDIGHATVEGGLSWPIEARLVAPLFSAVFVKDFRWEQSGRNWRPSWCPLGEGMVNKTFFQMLKASEFTGPICQHHEYETGPRATMRVHLKNDLVVLKEWLSQA
jgi:sugar phosphate isomerase/epimerase